jgi:hypothetical protein
MQQIFERVYSVTDYWDGPREGVADFRGTPHLFRSVFRSDLGAWDDDRHYLRPLTAEEAALAVEDWAIWRRFAGHYRGKVAPVTTDFADWGALPEDRNRHRELRALLAPVFALDVAQCVIASAEFRALEGAPADTVPGPMAPTLEVRWSDAVAHTGDVLVPSPAA